MKMILFKGKYRDLIDSGTKTQTIRFWQRCNLKAGDPVELKFSYSRPGIVGNIVSVAEKPYTELTIAEIEADGFKSISALEAALIECYGEIAPNQKCFVIKFNIPKK